MSLFRKSGRFEDESLGLFDGNSLEGFFFFPVFGDDHRQNTVVVFRFDIFFADSVSHVEGSRHSAVGSLAEHVIRFFVLFSLFVIAHRLHGPIAVLGRDVDVLLVEAGKPSS